MVADAAGLCGTSFSGRRPSRAEWLPGLRRLDSNGNDVVLGIDDPLNLS